MECPRCHEPNLPGVAHCSYCGRPMVAEPEAPRSFVPRVQTANPLDSDDRKPLVQDTPSYLFSDSGRSVGNGLWGGLLGFIPGLNPALRKEWSLVGAQLAALALTGLGVVLLWSHVLQPFALWTLYAAWGFSIGHEAHRRIKLLPAYRLGLSIWIALFYVMLGSGAGTMVFREVFDVVRIAGSVRLPAGEFLVEGLDGMPQVGDLLATQVGDVGVVVAPMLAGPGQRIEVEKRQLYVDGELTEVQALNPAGQFVRRVPEFTVPGGHVALYSIPLTATPLSSLKGRLYYRWTPIVDRGPLVWPPEEEE